MIEIIKHVLGVCGEIGHPNLLTFLVGGVGFTTFFSYIRWKIKEIKSRLW